MKNSAGWFLRGVSCKSNPLATVTVLIWKLAGAEVNKDIHFAGHLLTCSSAGLLTACFHMASPSQLTSSKDSVPRDPKGCYMTFMTRVLIASLLSYFNVWICQKPKEQGYKPSRLMGRISKIQGLLFGITQMIPTTTHNSPIGTTVHICV
jgi:hypothetical protein